MEKYKKQLLSLKFLPMHQKNIEAAGIINSCYKFLSKERFGKVDHSMVIVGGLSVEYYTAGNYMTADIDVVISSNDSKQQIPITILGDMRC
ncbi:MAG: hypothetical protein LBV67_09210 [Streptococcaceae bacterium]|jgi:hypothetical protein|nr:hypothetical protein [Streptococcaceae bacterium]